jgi:glycosyltransferase involved in cell wall biosynthesis
MRMMNFSSGKEKMLLSICIPTYNRVRYLKELLPTVLGQIDIGDIEVVVSDNASVDGTGDFLSSLEHHCFRWWTNDVNIGGDRNFLKCVAEAKGEYVWLFGDDDIMPEGIVSKVVDFLRNNKPVLLVSVDRDVPGIVYDDYREMLHDVGDDVVLAHTLISANVFRRECFDMEIAVKTLWVQYAHMFGIMSNAVGCKVGVMSRIVDTRPVRAEFAKYPSCLCVKQAVYMWWLSKRFEMPRFYCRAVKNACNLPMEYASRVWNFIKRKRFGV